MTIAENIFNIKQKLAKINPNTKLIAISKNHSIEKVLEAINAGHKIFGENKVQEAATKFRNIKNIELHMVGSLQTNKAKEALQIFDIIQTLDREKLAHELVKWINSNAISVRTKSFFIQVNIGNEPQKSGIEPKYTANFYNFCKSDLGLNIVGLMCIPPVNTNPETYFALLKNIAKQLPEPIKLSMGMSADYELATQQGADYVRIGTAIFGARL